MPQKEIWQYPATELLPKLKKGELSSREVVEAHIRRIEELEPRLNAMAISRFGEALAEAEEADALREKGGKLPPLHGLPISIKEQFKVQGMDTTFGMEQHRNKPFPEDGPIVGLMRKAGGIVLGKTNVMLTLMGYESDNNLYGQTNNPYDPARTPGGSSGGEGALIAGGGSPLGLGGDLGGSIRIPSHFCGIHGLKPTAGRFTIADTPGNLFGPGQNVIWPVIGPMARSVDDLILAMEIMAQPLGQPTFDFHPPIKWQGPEKIDVKNLRIGFYVDDDYFPAAPALRRVVEEAAAVLEGQGLEVKRFQPPQVAAAIGYFLGASFMDGGQWFIETIGDEKPIPAIRELLRGLKAPDFLRKAIAGISEMGGQKYFAFQAGQIKKGSARDYFHMVRDIWVYRNHFHQEMEKAGVDVLLAPPFGLPAPRHGTTGQLTPAASYAMLFNVLGMPAGVVAASRVKAGEESDRKVGRDQTDKQALQTEEGSAGLPVGVQVAAGHWHEDRVLAVMKILEEHFSTQEDYPVGAAFN